MAFSWPDISQNQMMQAGLGLLGSGFGRGKTNPFLAAGQGLAYGQEMDIRNEERERQQAAAERQARLDAAWAGMFGVGDPEGQPQPETAMQPPVGPADGLRMPGSPGMPQAPSTGPQMASAGPGMQGMGPQPAQGAPGGPQGNPMLANIPPQMRPLLAAMGPEKGAQYLWDAMNRKEPERRIVTGLDGRNYYEDTKEPVLPGVKPKPQDPPAGYRMGEDGNLQADPGWLAAQIKLRQAGRSQTNVNVDTVGKSLSPGQKKIDETYAADYADFVLGGGYADAASNLDQIGEVIGRLRKGEGLTGGMGARLPDWARSYLDPEGMDTQQLTEQVVQRNLREVLGPQFTEKEGERLIARAYDPRLPEEKNLARLERLFGAMSEALDARKEAADYFEENETMKGYQGAKRVTIRDLEKALEEPKGEAQDFFAMDRSDLLSIDETTLSDEELDAYAEALRKATK